MAPETVSDRPWADTPTWYSVARSLFTHYWLFTGVVMAFALWGMALAPTFDTTLVGLLLVALALGMEGMHDLDLSDPTLTVDVDPRVQRTIGYGLIAAGTAVGCYLAARTSWWFLAFVAAEVLAGLAYNREWAGGLFHDLDRLGPLTGALSLGFLPVVLGHFLLAETVGLPVLLWGAVAGGYSVGILHVYQAVKVPVLYDAMGIRHERSATVSDAEALELVTRGLLIVLVSTVASGVAFAAVAITG